MVNALLQTNRLLVVGRQGLEPCLLGYEPSTLYPVSYRPYNFNTSTLYL